MLVAPDIAAHTCGKHERDSAYLDCKCLYNAVAQTSILNAFFSFFNSGVVLLDEVGHCLDIGERRAVDLDCRISFVAEKTLYRSQRGLGLVDYLVCPLVLPGKSSLLIVNICLVGFPAFQLCGEFAHLALGLIFQHGIFRATQLCRDVAEHIFRFLECAGVHRIAHQFLAVHHAVGNRAFGLQSLICRHIERILDTETEHSYRDTPFLMEIALTEYAAIALGIVHRAVRRVYMNKCMQTFLNVHAGAECKGASHYHADFSTVDLVEDFQLLLYRHIRCHYHDPVGRDTLLFQLLLYVLIKIEFYFTCRFVLALIVVSEYCDSAAVALAVFERAQSLSDCLIGFAVRVIVCIRLNKTGVNGCGLGYAVAYKRYMAIGFLLLAGHILKAVKFAFHVEHDAAQCACLRQEDIGSLAALYLGYLVLHISGLACQHGVGNSRPYTYKFGQVHIPGKAVVFPELATR